MRFLFNGLPFFGKKITGDLKEIAPEHSFHFYDTYYSRTDQVKFACMVPFSDLVFSINGVSDRSGSLDLVLFFKKKLILYWIGTDVLMALDRARKNTLSRKYIDYAQNFACAPWLSEELKQIHVSSRLLAFNGVDVKEDRSPFLELAVYTYLSSGREDFYGWPVIRELCKRFPELKFYVAGSTGENLEQPENVIFMGWLSADEMERLRNRVPVFIRFAVHDGISLAVTEALSVGNEVIRNIAAEQCHYASDVNSAAAQLQKIVALLKARNLSRNFDNMKYVADHYSRKVVVTKFLDTLLAVART